MKAIILAAGQGIRLGTNFPKPLCKITKGKTILDFQVEKLSKKIGFDNILITVGYKKELIMRRIPDLIFVYNQKYQKTSTAKSLLLALKKINDDVICIDGDVYFDEKILDMLLKTKYSCCLVDTKKCGKEESKYNLKNGFIWQMSKSNKNPLGEALGINIIRKKDLNVFRNELKSLSDNERVDKALENLTTRNKLKLMPVYVGNYYCQEIDFKSDLNHVRKYVSRQSH